MTLHSAFVPFSVRNTVCNTLSATLSATLCRNTVCNSLSATLYPQHCLQHSVRKTVHNTVRNTVTPFGLRPFLCTQPCLQHSVRNTPSATLCMQHCFKLFCLQQCLQLFCPQHSARNTVCSTLYGTLLSAILSDLAIFSRFFVLLVVFRTGLWFYCSLLGFSCT